MKSQQKECEKISKLSLNVTLNQNIESFEYQNNINNQDSNNYKSNNNVYYNESSLNK